MKVKIFLILIIFLSAFLRLYQLDKVPSGFHIDEVTVGYNAYSLLKTAQDEHSNFLPLYIDSFGDFPPAGYFYLTIPSILIFGLNEFAVRFPHAVFGILTVLLTYLLAEKIFHKRFISLLSAFLMAVSPWHIVITRATSESSSALFLIMLGAYFFLMASENRKGFYFLASLFFFLLSYYVYPAPRIQVPILALVLVGLSWQKLGSSSLKKTAVGFAVACLVAALLVVFSGSGRGRFNQVGILSQPGIQLRLDEQIREELPGTNVLLVRIFHNKFVNYSLEIMSNYGKHFSFDSLFITGGLPIRYRIPEAGLLYLAELPFLLLGFYQLLKNKDRLSLLPVFWVLIGPIAASLTFEDIPNVRRAFFMLPGFQLITAYGFYTALEKIKSQGKIAGGILISLSSLALIFNVGYFAHQYFIHQRVYRPWYRNYGFKELISVMNKLSPNYQKIELTKDPNDPYIYILFYNQYNPALAQKYVFHRSKEKWGFEKYVFFPSKCPSYVKNEVLQKEKTLFVDGGECELRPYSQVVKKIYREDRTPAFNLIEVDKTNAEEYFKKEQIL